MTPEQHEKLRDQFALAALAGALGQGVREDGGDWPEGVGWSLTAEEVAIRAWQIADAMLEFRDDCGGSQE